MIQKLTINIQKWENIEFSLPKSIDCPTNFDSHRFSLTWCYRMRRNVQVTFLENWKMPMFYIAIECVSILEKYYSVYFYIYSLFEVIWNFTLIHTHTHNSFYHSRIAIFGRKKNKTQNLWLSHHHHLIHSTFTYKKNYKSVKRFEKLHFFGSSNSKKNWESPSTNVNNDDEFHANNFINHHSPRDWLIAM
jgi:hypothetical protein